MKTIQIIEIYLSTTGFWIKLFNRGFAITRMSKPLFFLGFKHRVKRKNPRKHLKIGNCYIYFLRG